MLVFGNRSFKLVSTEFDRTGIIWCLYARPEKSVKFYSKLFHMNNILQKHVSSL